MKPQSPFQRWLRETEERNGYLFTFWNPAFFDEGRVKIRKDRVVSSGGDPVLAVRPPVPTPVIEGEGKGVLPVV